jgi:hypothetical protein
LAASAAHKGVEQENEARTATASGKTRRRLLRHSSPAVAIDAVSAPRAAVAKGLLALNRRLAPPTATKAS